METEQKIKDLIKEVSVSNREVKIKEIDTRKDITEIRFISKGFCVKSKYLKNIEWVQITDGLQRRLHLVFNINNKRYEFVIEEQ